MKVITAGLLFLISTQMLAGDLSGKVTVLKKGSDQPEANFRNALVYIKGIATTAPTSPRIQTQKNKQFTPRLLAVVKGQSVDFRNEDRVQHNVFSTDKKNPFDLGRYPAGEHRSVTFTQTGLQPVYCDIHQNMVSYIAVLDNTFYAYTNTQGDYQIKNVPDGEYTLHVWHIYGGVDEKPVKVNTDAQQHDFTIHSTKLIRDLNDHTNKSGAKYNAYQFDDDSDYDGFNQ